MRRNLSGWRARLAPHLVFLIPELLMAAGPFVVRRWRVPMGAGHSACPTSSTVARR